MASIRGEAAAGAAVGMIALIAAMGGMLAGCGLAAAEEDEPMTVDAA